MLRRGFDLVERRPTTAHFLDDLLRRQSGRLVRGEWEPEDPIACWTLVEGDAALVGNKSGATRLGFALLLRFFDLEGRFPRRVGELPSQR